MKRLSGNCLLAQSGGPTSVINSSAYGVIKEFAFLNPEDKIYAGIYGIEGILQNKIVDIGNIDKGLLEGMKYLPSVALGSCRYKLKDFEDSEAEYEKIFARFKEHNIRYFFYIGGNDSMDAACKLDEYAKIINYEINIMGVPKTIDNDLVGTDHCPGFGSAVKYASNVAMELWMDINAYDFNSIMVLETMGRDTGWIAAATGIIKKSIPDINQLIYVPEIAFSEDKLLLEVKKAYDNYGKLLIVTSEGLRDEKNEYISADANCYEKDVFGHKQLGGIGKYIQTLLKNNIEKRVKLTELGVPQRCAMHLVSKVDLDEAEMVGREAVKYSLKDNSGYMVALKRSTEGEYKCTTELATLKDVCNKVKNVPTEWFNKENKNINQHMINYVEPLMAGQVNCFDNNGLLKYTDLSKVLKI
jgi:ATP-dependent phosphofructokinase / diphosphate-dependent phosphofructokinase